MAVSAILVEAGLAFAGAVVAMALDAFASRRAAAWGALAGLALAAAAGAVSWFLPGLGVGRVAIIGSSLASTGAAVALLAALALAGGWRRFAHGVRGGEAAALVAVSTAGAIGSLWARDLVTLLVLLEVMGLAGYAMVALAGTAPARESAMKYFVQGAIATGFAVFGLGVLYAASGGTVAYAGILAAVEQPAFAALARPLLAGGALVLVTLGFKVGAFPMHSWAPDVYETAEVADAAYLASAPKVAAMVALAVFVLTALGRDVSPAPRVLVAVLCTGSIVVGNFAALSQMSLRRMLAYSGIAQVGYALVALTGADRGQAILIFAPLYGLAALGAFLAAQAVGETESGWDGSVAGLSGLAARRPALAAALSVCLLSMMGLPLTAGFFAKFLVFAAAVGAGYTWLAVVGVLGSVVSFGYYGRVIRVMYFEEGDGTPRPQATARPASRVTGAIAIVLVIVGVAPVFAGINWLMTIMGLR